MKKTRRTPRNQLMRQHDKKIIGDCEISINLSTQRSTSRGLCPFVFFLTMYPIIHVYIYKFSSNWAVSLLGGPKPSGNTGNVFSVHLKTTNYDKLLSKNTRWCGQTTLYVQITTLLLSVNHDIYMKTTTRIRVTRSRLGFYHAESTSS